MSGARVIRAGGRWPAGSSGGGGEGPALVGWMARRVQDLAGPGRGSPCRLSLGSGVEA